MATATSVQQGTNISGKWIGILRGRNPDPNEVPVDMYEMELSQTGSIIAGTSTITEIGEEQYYGTMKLRGLVNGTTFSFVEYEITFQERRGGGYWCEKSGTLEYRQENGQEILEGSWEDPGCSLGTARLVRQKDANGEVPTVFDTQTNISGSWSGEFLGLDPKPGDVPSHLSEMELTQTGNIVTGKSTIVEIADSQYYGIMKLRGLVNGTTFSFVEYEITFQERRGGGYWCE
ncbi:MAG: hypothetical protein WCD37_02600, partial [Chloroflexia bacterium]